MKILDDINNPAPQWDDYRILLSSIPPALKALMKEKIKENLGCSVLKLADILDEISPLSHDQNLTIAWTETMRTDVMANFQTYLYSGQVDRKEWLLASDENCPICIKNALVGAIGLNDLFPSGDAAPPAHPRCRCDLLPVLKAEDFKSDQEPIKKLGGFKAMVSLIRKIFAFSLMVIFLAGCATTVSSPQQVTDATQVKFDPYSNRYSVSGMQMNRGGFPNITRFWLRGGFDKTGGTEFIQLYVYHWSQTGWNFFSQASDITGTPLNLRQLDREVNTNATVEEQVAIDLPRDFLESRKTQGLNIRLLGSKGSLVVEVPSAYIIGFLEKYDTALKGFKQANKAG